MATITKFSISFSSPYTFGKDIDFRAFYQGESLDYVKNRVIGYNAQQLIVGVQSQGQKERKVTFNISPEALQVSCNCKSSEGTLCAHGYHALHELCWNSKRFFTIFEPGNLVSIALDNKNLFHIDYSNPDEFIVPDKSLGHLYDFKKIEPTELQKLPALPAVAFPARETELVWLLIYSPYAWQRYLPILVPIKGTLDKAGNNIRSFGKGFANISEKLLTTNDRKRLYNLSKAMYSPATDRHKFDWEEMLAGEMHIAENFRQWEQTLPMLSGQPFVYKYDLAHIRYFMSNPPRRKYLERITISTERPQLQFILKNKGSYYRLSLQYLLHGVPIKDPVEDALFFIRNDAQYHLLGSLRDAAMVQWMSGFDNLISVLKPGFAEFEKEVLQRIEEMYPVVGR
ncbi:MAG: hypothetical protein ACTHOB_04480 [Ginsengibacter sp.]